MDQSLEPILESNDKMACFEGKEAPIFTSPDPEPAPIESTDIPIPSESPKPPKRKLSDEDQSEVEKDQSPKKTRPESPRKVPEPIFDEVTSSGSSGSSGDAKDSEVAEDSSEDEEDGPNLTWHTAKCIEKELMTSARELTCQQRRRIERLIKKFEESGCSIEIPFTREADYDGLKSVLFQALTKGYHATEARKRLKPPTASDKAPMLLLTSTNPKFMEDGIKGSDILKAAKKWADEKRNIVFDTKSLKMIKLMEGWKPTSTFLRDKGFVEGNREEVGTLLPLVVLNVNKGFDEQELERQVTSLSTVVIRGLPEACGMDFGAFEVEEITKLDPDQEITILRHRPQPSTTNFRMSSQGIKDARQWDVDTVEEKTRTLDGFMQNYREIQKVGREGFEKLISDWSNRETIIAKMTADLKSAQFPLLNQDKVIHESFPISSFASNVDLDPEIYVYQHEQIAKLPSFCRPKKGFMEYCDSTLPGINEVQMYLKAPGGRTPGHLENQVMASINLNIGPGDCTWICIPMMHIAKVEKYLRDHSIFPYASTFWINEEDLKAHGIPYQKFVQKKGDLVYVGVGTYHWVQANSYCANVSWNVAQMDAVQLMASALIHDHNAEQRYASVVPIVPMMWMMCMDRESEGTEISKITKKLLVSSLARSQFELDTARIKKIPVIPIEESEFNIPLVAICSRTTCPRATLFNLIVVNRGDFETPITCVDCAPMNGHLKAFQRYSMEELVQYYDDYN